jgi:hypothetical protein
LAHVTLEIIEVTGSVVEVVSDTSVLLEINALTAPTVEVIANPDPPTLVEVTTGPVGPQGPPGPGAQILEVGPTEPNTAGWDTDNFWYDTSTE